MTPEGKVKRKIDRRLDQLGAYYHKPVQNGMGAPALDYHTCLLRGRYFAIEAKAPGEWLTKRQEQTAAEIVAAGGSWFCIDDSDLSWETFELFISFIP